jgi:hypothetical protein
MKAKRLVHFSLGELPRNGGSFPRNFAETQEPQWLCNTVLERSTPEWATESRKPNPRWIHVGEMGVAF